MIGIKQMHEIYVSNIRNNITTYDDMLERLEASKKYILSKLIKYELYIRNFTRIKYENIESFNILLSLEDIIFYDKANTADEIKNRISLITDINNLVSINVKIKRVTYELEKLKKRQQRFIIYKFILGSYNKKISQGILEGESFNLGFRLGIIRIQKKKRYKGDERVEEFQPHNYKVVNWGESNKLKKEIIDRGGIPYKAIKDSDGNIIGDNGGEQWLIYFVDDFSYWWMWQKYCKDDRNKVTMVKNQSKFSFSPTKGKKGNRLLLQTLLKTNPSAALNYSF